MVFAAGRRGPTAALTPAQSRPCRPARYVGVSLGFVGDWWVVFWVWDAHFWVAEKPALF